MTVLGDLGSLAREALPALRDRSARGDPWYERTYALEARWRIAHEAEAVAGLLALLDEKSADADRPRTLGALGRIAPENKDALAAVRTAFQRRPYVELAETLWNVAQAPEAVTFLADAVQDLPRRQAGDPGPLLALGRIGGPAKAALPALAEALPRLRES